MCIKNFVIRPFNKERKSNFFPIAVYTHIFILKPLLIIPEKWKKSFWFVQPEEAFLFAQTALCSIRFHYTKCFFQSLKPYLYCQFTLFLQLRLDPWIPSVWVLNLGLWSNDDKYVFLVLQAFWGNCKSAENTCQRSIKVPPKRLDFLGRDMLWIEPHVSICFLYQKLPTQIFFFSTSDFALPIYTLPCLAFYFIPNV